MAFKMYSENSFTPQRLHAASFEASKDSSVNVMQAFRQLQLKAREIESLRDTALRERDESQRQIYEKGRRDSLMRSRVMSNTNEKLLGIQGDNDRIRRDNEELEASIRDINEICATLQRDIGDRRKRLNEETEASGNMDTLSIETYKIGRQMESEIAKSEVRIHDLNEQYQRFHVRASDSVTSKKADIRSTMNEVATAKENLNNLKMRASVIENYMDMLIQINTDLVEAVQAKQEAKEQISQFVVVPRYSWPKGIVKKATQIVTEAAATDLHKQKARAASEQSKVSKLRGVAMGGERKSKKSAAVTPRLRDSALFRKKTNATTEKVLEVKADARLSKGNNMKGKPEIKGYLRPKTY